MFNWFLPRADPYVIAAGAQLITGVALFTTKVTLAVLPA
jgi:hypothetical protein